MPVLQPVDTPSPDKADKAMTLNLAALHNGNIAPEPTDFSEPSSSSMAASLPSRTVEPSETTQSLSVPTATASDAPLQRQCFTNAEGVKICYMYAQQAQNSTDIHKEGGELLGDLRTVCLMDVLLRFHADVNDYHHQSGESEKQGIQGHIPGNNITDTLDHLGDKPSADEHKDGNTVFQGKGETQTDYQHDIHKDNSTFTDHELSTGEGDLDWKSAFKGPDGSKEMAEIDKDGQFKSEEDTRVDAQGKNQVAVQEATGSDDHRFVSDKPGTVDDSSLVWDEDWRSKTQKEEFSGQGVYDLHEESSSAHQVQAKVDGDQGWKDFEQDMRDFDDVFFDENAAWKEKMKDPRFTATATTLSTVIVRGASPTTLGAPEMALDGLVSRARDCLSAVSGTMLICLFCLQAHRNDEEYKDDFYGDRDKGVYGYIGEEFDHQHDVIEQEEKEGKSDNSPLYVLHQMPGGGRVMRRGDGDEYKDDFYGDRDKGIYEYIGEEFDHQHDVMKQEEKEGKPDNSPLYMLPPIPGGDRGTLPGLALIRDAPGNATRDDVQEDGPHVWTKTEVANCSVIALCGLVIVGLFVHLAYRCRRRKR